MRLCYMCHEMHEETNLFALYVSGSEGLRVCHECEVAIVRFCQGQARAALRRRKEEHKAQRRAEVPGAQ